MVFGSKPKKPGSILPRDKRKISLLNSDFKTATGLEASLLKEFATHTLSPLQLVAGSDRKIQHGINKARNAIHAAGKPGHPGCGILDTDLIAAFDFLCLDWVFQVLEMKGLDSRVIARYKNLYKDNYSVVVVNNVQGRAVKNIRLSLRQGDLPSMHFFSYGIDPLLTFLDKRLRGILIASLPTYGPALQGAPPLPALEERYRVIGYADDVKPAITSMNEFLTVDNAMALFEKASGCQLHRDPSTKKCKFLPLARWRGTLQQEDIPCGYMSISDHLEMLGVELRATWTQTRKANGDALQSRIENTIRQWKSGKFMYLSLRSWSLNTYCLPKIWFRTHSVDLRVQDLTKITSKIKSWLYGDMLLKPEEMIMSRPVSFGGLGVHNVKMKALAGLITTFMETASNPKYSQSLYHNNLFRYYVLEDTSIPDPGLPPFYSGSFFATIKKVHEESPLNVTAMSEQQWYRLLLEENVTMEELETGESRFMACRVELASPWTDWEISWRLSRLPGLGPEHSSFLFKLLHQILPTQERVSRTSPTTNSLCKHRDCTGDSTEDIPHCLVYCRGNDGVGMKLVECARTVAPGQSVEQFLQLNLGVEESMELATVWWLSAGWLAIWNLRAAGKKIDHYLVRAQLEAKINLLRETRFAEATLILDRVIRNF